ncbi:metal-dependent membrane protease [gut metagenome]|uniref:Metal-dependent membrane protease n=1 Tax=gut metagenome TaxID=749906 RepID=J9BS04_9ZZZZ
MVFGLLSFSMEETQEIIVFQLMEVLAIFAAYGSLKKICKLPLPKLGLSIKGRLTDMVGGFLAAVLLYGVGFGVSYIVGWVQVEAVHWLWLSLLTSFGFFFLVAVFEEVFLRGIVLGHLLDGGMPKYAALLLSSMLFSALHLFNPDFSWLPFLNLFLAGILLGSSYIYTRNLWFPIFLLLVLELVARTGVGV